MNKFINGSLVSESLSFTDLDSAAMAASTLQTLPHGVAGGPTKWEALLVCVIAQDGYAVGDEVELNLCDQNTSGRFIGVWADDTNFYVLPGNGGVFYMSSAVTGNIVNMNIVGWKVRFRYIAQ